MTTERPVPVLRAEVHALPLKGGQVLIYAPLRRVAFVASPALARILAGVERGCYEPEMDRGGSSLAFLRRVGLVDGEPEHAPATELDAEPATVEATLLLTTACNLRCTYCYASGGDREPEHMSLETACSGIDFVARNAKRRGSGYFAVSYHGGGEPTQNWEVLTGSHWYATALAEREGLRCESAVCTNGVMTDKQVCWLAKHLTGATVSFDGLPEVHDRHRVTAAGEGSSRQVERTLRLFDAAQFSYSLRITVTAEHTARLPDTVDYVCAEFRPNAVQVEPVYLLGRGAANDSAETEEFIEAYRRAQERAMGHGKRIGFSAARPGVITNHFCAATRDSFCLSTAGNVTACYEVFSEDHAQAGRFFYGRPAGRRGEYAFDAAVLRTLRAQGVEYREFCRGCFCRWNCGGDCYQKGLSVHGGNPIEGTGRCKIIRELTKDELLEKIAASGGLVWLGNKGLRDGQLC